jgi:hypothetical protein
MGKQSVNAFAQTTSKVISGSASTDGLVGERPAPGSGVLGGI